jgi:hypothetical protein
MIIIYLENIHYGGIYYVDTLFNNNLKLKAGINLNCFKKQGKVYDLIPV